MTTLIAVMGTSENQGIYAWISLPEKAHSTFETTQSAPIFPP